MVAQQERDLASAATDISPVGFKVAPPLLDPGQDMAGFYQERQEWDLPIGIA